MRRRAGFRAGVAVPRIRDETDPALDADARAARGRLVNFNRALANRPGVLRAITGLLKAAYRQDSSLEPRHGELAYLTATTVNNCFY